jgi:Family of unknown function (DUF5832)
MSSLNPAPFEPSKAETKYVDFLEEDTIKCPGLRYAIISVVTCSGRQRMQLKDGEAKIGLKIRGAFETKEQAHDHIKKLQLSDNSSFDVWLVDLYKWLLLPPDPNNEDVETEYGEPFLNELVKGWRENQIFAKQHFEERKQAVMRDGLDKHLTAEERLPAPTESALEALKSLDNDPHPSASGSRSN